jgi:dipeptidyl aminopeptidase/acylaminoacyl peptidase
MLVGLRSDSLGKATLLVNEGSVTKLAAPFVYTGWHPSGRIVAYSSNKVRQFFHTAAEVRDVVDLESSLWYFCVATGQSKRVSGAADSQHLATYPTWSPDGRWLYYCRAARLWTEPDSIPPDRYAEVKYDLVRMSYDIEMDRWGSPETVLSAKETGLSILLPRVSPDGRFLLFCMCRYGCFPAFQPTSDLYLLDLQKGTYVKPPINSEYAESWHSWSSNSRWIAFSSKREGGIFTRCYLSYVDSSGQAHRPLVVPQADPEFYNSFLKTFSVPELLSGPVPVSSAALMRAARSEGTAIESPNEAPSKLDDTESYRHADR